MVTERTKTAKRQARRASRFYAGIAGAQPREGMKVTKMILSSPNKLPCKRATVRLGMPLAAMLVLFGGLATQTSAPAASPAIPRNSQIVAQLGKREVLLGLNQKRPKNPNVTAASSASTFLPQKQRGLPAGPLKYFPDGCMAFLQMAPGYRILLAAGTSTWLVEGADLRSLSPTAEVLQPGPPGAFDNGYAGIGGAVLETGSHEWLALYHAEDQEGMKAIPGGIPGFYCSVALATSYDDGRSFRKVGPVITSPLPKDPHGHADQGCGEPCMLLSHNGAYYYAYYTSHSRADGRGVQICLARSRETDRGVPGTWFKYYEHLFEEPGLGGRDTPVMSAAAMKGDALFPQVTYLPALGAYIMVFNIHVYRELTADGEPQESGIYAAWSADGIRWSPPVQLVRIRVLPLLGREIGWHPTLLVTSRGSHSVQGWLLYAYSEQWGHRPPQKPHYLVGQPIRLSIVQK